MTKKLPLRWLCALLPVVGLFLIAGCRHLTTSPVAQPVSALKLLVEEDGLYRLTAAELKKAGLSFDSLDPDSLALSEAGEPVPYVLDGDALIFYGQSSQSRYTSYRTYIVRTGVPGTVMQSAPVPPSAGPQLDRLPTTLHLEENWEYSSDARTAGNAEPWFWQTIGLNSTVSVAATLPSVADGAAELQIHLYGTTYNPDVEPDHSVALAVNGVQAAQLTWDGQTAFTGTVTLPPSSLRDGENSLSLQNIPEEYLDIMKLDRLRIAYESLPVAQNDRFQFNGAAGRVALSGFTARPQLFDVADPASPLLLSEWDYEDGVAHFSVQESMHVAASGPNGFLTPAALSPLRATDWKSPEQGADLIVVTTDQLSPALEPFVAARQEQGMRVALLPVQEVYDTFGHGQATPDSINQFLKYAHENWQKPAPRYLLLVGDATLDYRGYLQRRPHEPVSPPQNVIPPYLVNVSFGGETVSDARLADVDDDLKPDLSVGRWPVDSIREVEQLVRRTLAYEEQAPQQQALFAADGTSDQFRNLTNRLIENSGFPGATATIMNGPTSAALSEEWNQGAWLINYTGHGSLQLWGREEVFSVDAVEQLSAGAGAPIVVQLTCLTGLFAHPETRSLSEVLLTEDNGPVLLIAATSLTLSSHQEPFAVSLLQGLQDPSFQRIGDVMLHAKHSLDTGNDGLREISDTFGLIGDPTALIVRP